MTTKPPRALLAPQSGIIESLYTEKMSATTVEMPGETNDANAVYHG